MYTYLLPTAATPLLILFVLAFYWRPGETRRLADAGFLRSAACFVLSSVVVCLPLSFYFLSHQGSFFGYAARLALLWNRRNPLQAPR